MTFEILYDELLKQWSSFNFLNINNAVVEDFFHNLLLILDMHEIHIFNCSLNKIDNKILVTGNLEQLSGTINAKKGEGDVSSLYIDLCVYKQEREELYYQVKIRLVCKSLIEKLFGRTEVPFRENISEEAGLFQGISFTNPVFWYDSRQWKIEIEGFSSMTEEAVQWKRYAGLLKETMPIQGEVLPSGSNFPLLRVRFLTQNQVEFVLGKGIGTLVITSIPDYMQSDIFHPVQAYLELEVLLYNLKKKIQFRVELFSRQKQWNCSAFIAPPLAIPNIMVMLKDVFKLPDYLALMPQGAFISSFGLEGLDVIFEPTVKDTFNGLSMKHIRGIFSLKKPLEFYVPNFVLNNFKMAWEVSKWSSNTPVVTLFLTAASSFVIGNIKMEGTVSAYFPYMQFKGSLKLKEQRSLQELAKSANVNLPNEWKRNVDGESRNNEILSIDVIADGIQRNVKLYFYISDVLNLNINQQLAFVLQNLSVELAYYSENMEFAISGLLAFQYKEEMNQNNFAFFLRAAYANNNWVFTGNLAYGEVNIKMLIQSILGITVEDTASKNLVLEDLSVSYAMQKKELIIYATCKVWFDILGSSPELGGRLRLRCVGEEKEAALLTYVKIEELKLKILAQVDDVYALNKKYRFRIELFQTYVQAVYQKKEEGEILEFSLGGITLGDIVLEFIHLINPNARNSLSEPWNILNQIKLSDISVEYNITKKKISFLYNLNSNIAGLMYIEKIGIKYSYDEKKQGTKIEYILTGSCLGQKFTEDEPFSWDAQNGSPEGNVATNEKKFQLNYLALGNNLDLDVAGSTISEIIENVKNSIQPESGIPSFTYREMSGWLIAADLEVSSMFQVKLLLYDPKIYGAAIKLDLKEESDDSPLKFLSGLFLELFYKKISDETGMFHCRMTLPKKYTELDLGAVKLYLGEILVEIYTNGSFYIDLGFPHNQDFSGSWGIVLGIYSGRGGVYLGEFHGDAVNSVPKIINGAFSPVVKIGIGLEVGLAHSFNFGVVKGGVSLTATGIFEGVFAIFNPIDTNKDRAMYYKVSATVGVVGSLFLSVDFKIIAISAAAQISAFCTLEIESYRRAQISVELELKLKAYIKILFFKISFSFHFKQNAKFYFGADKETPWELETQNKKSPNKQEYSNIVLNIEKLFNKIQIAPIVTPMCSLTESGKNCMVFPVFLKQEDFKAIVTLLMELLCDDKTAFLTEEFIEALQEENWVNRIDYDFVLKLFSQNIQVNIGISDGRDVTDKEINGIIFPMLPQLSMQINDKLVDFGAVQVDEKYINKLSEYFEMFNADEGYSARKETNSIGKVPICGALLTDWIQIIVKELAACICEGKMGSYITWKEQVLSQDNIVKIGALVSRAFLQGTRIPEPNTQEQKPMYEVLGQQIELPDSLTDYQLQLNCTTNDIWIHIVTERLKLTSDTVSSWLVKDKEEIIDNIVEIPDFLEQNECFTMATGWSIGGNNESKYLGLLPQPACSYLKRNQKAFIVKGNQEETESIQWTTTVTIQVYRKSHGVYCITGLKAEDLEAAYCLIAEKNLECKLFYRTSPLESEEEKLFPVNSEGGTLIKTNLSKVTHYVKNFHSEENKQYIVNIQNGSEFIKLLWECSVTGGGYWFFLPNDNIPDTVFDEEEYGNITLVVIQEQLEIHWKAVNSLFLQIVPKNVVLCGELEKIKLPALPTGCVGFTIKRAFDNEDSFQSLFQLFGYEVEEWCGKKERYESVPIIPTVQGEEETTNMFYQVVFPMWKMYGDNPYGGIGKSSHLKLFVRDIFGNRRMVQIARQSEPEYSVKGTYNDVLIGLHEIPLTKLNYCFAKDETNQYLKIVCKAVSVNEKTDIDRVKAAIYKAKQQLTCEDIQMSVSFSLGNVTFPENAMEKVHKYLEQLYQYVCDNSVPLPIFELLCIIQQDKNEKLLSPIEVTLTVTRDKRYCNDSAAHLAISKILADDNMTEEDFEKNFQSVFFENILAYDNQNQPISVSARIFNNFDETQFGIAPYEFKLDNQTVYSPEYYAMAPLANTLLTREIDSYSFVNIDANLWEKQFLSDLESLLTGDMVCSASHKCPDAVSKLVSIKEVVAEQLARRIVPVRKGEDVPVPQEVFELAAEHFRKNLNLAYEAETIAVYQVFWNNKTNYRMEPRIESDYCLGATKIKTTTLGQKSALCLFLEETQKSINDLKVSFPYLEYNIEAGIEGYEKSEWLRFVTALTKNVNFFSDVSVPFPKKKIPLPPQLLEQHNETREGQFLEYDWYCTISANLCNQDILYIQLDYEEISVKKYRSHDKVDVLAGYQTERNKILEMLKEENNLAYAYSKFAFYAEQYINAMMLVTLETTKHSQRDNSIMIMLGFTFQEKAEATVRIINQTEVSQKMSALGAKLSVPEKIECVNDNNFVEFKIGVKNFPIYQCHRITPKAHIVRNADIFQNPKIKVSDNFIFGTEVMELPPIQVSVEHKKPIIIKKSSVAEAVQKLWTDLKMEKYSQKLCLNATVFYEYLVGKAERGIMARTPVTFMTDILSADDMNNNLQAWRGDMKNGRLTWEIRVYEKETDMVILACEIVVPLEDMV